MSTGILCTGFVEFHGGVSSFEDIVAVSSDFELGVVIMVGFVIKPSRCPKVTSGQAIVSVLLLCIVSSWCKVWP